MFIGVFGLHAEGIITDFSGSVGGQTLVKASSFATGRQIEQLLAWGANPNYEDPVSGTPLDAAILGANVAAVKILLDHKADPNRPYLDGRDPRQMASTLGEPQRAAILAALDHATGGRAGGADAIGSPLKAGYRYRLRKAFESDSLGYHMPTTITHASCFESQATGRTNSPIWGWQKTSSLCGRIGSRNSGPRSSLDRNTRRLPL
jgi:hypothetical protein